MLNLKKNDRLNFNDGKNYSEFENICTALQESLPDFDIRMLKPYLWRDEIKDIFMLTKTMEIYLFNRYTLNCYCWNANTYRKIKAAGLMLEDSGADDTGIYQFKSDIINLPDLQNLSGKVIQRMTVRSNKRKRLENRLGHKIFKCEFRFSTWKALQAKNDYGKNPNLNNVPDKRADNAA